MTFEKMILALLAETPLHAGTGAQLGSVDLPIQRERHTGWPTIYGTGLKGVFRDEADRTAGWDKPRISAVFGPETEKNSGKEADRHSGALAISDARLLLFPVRPVGLAFAWLTCPLALARLARDLSDVGLPSPPDVPERPDADRATVCPAYAEPKILLEEFEYGALKSETLAQVGSWVANNLLPKKPEYKFWREHASKALVMVSDEDFRDFVQHGTEIVTRVKLTPHKTVEKRMLWTEENLPSETLLYCFVAAWKPVSSIDETLVTAQDVAKVFAELLAKCAVIQVGGKETVGRGFASATLIGGGNA